MAPMTLEQATAQVCATDPRFELTNNVVRGVEYPVYKNAPVCLHEMLRRARDVHGNGEDEYLVYLEERWTYNEFCDEVNRMGHALQNELGVKKNDRIALAMRNYPELLFLMLAISSFGAVVVFLNGWWTTDELDYALEDSGAKIIFADDERFERLEPLKPSRGLQLIGVRNADDGFENTYSGLRQRSTDTSWIDANLDTDDDFAIMYSSGSTGHPKGVVQTHRGAVSATYSWLSTFFVLPLMMPADPNPPPAVQQVILIVTPLFHVTATHPSFLLSIPLGAKVVLMYKWDADEAVRLIDRENVTRFLGVPTQTADLKVAAERLGSSLPSLSSLSSGGAKRPASQVAELQDAFPHASIASGWGMTETNGLGLGITGPDYLARPGAAGRLYPAIQQLRILDDDGNIMPNGEVGELTVKSAANMRCYLNKPEATEEVLQDGWLRTGDLAHVDDQGYVTIVDRKKNIIIRGGENIACLDVEGAIHRHPSVVEAGVFSVPHERLGEVVGTGVQVKTGHSLSASELSLFLADHIAKFKIPEHYWFRETELPRGATDKTDRRALRSQCLADFEET